MKKLLNKVIALSLMLLLTITTSVSAVTVTVGQNCTQSFVNAKFYLGGTTKVPTRTSITGSDNGYISVGDLCTIKDTSNATYWKVQYPVSGGTKTAYVKKTSILSNATYSKRIKVAQNTTVYTNSNMTTKFGTTYTTDTITMLTPISNGKAQIIYNVTGGYKIGWIYASQIGTGTSTPNTGNKVSMSSVLYGVPSISSKLTCKFDGYVNTKGRHEGIDFAYGYGKNVYSLTDGEVINVNRSTSLSTIAIYDKTANKTVLYLHANPTISVGATVKKGTKIATEANYGAGSATHTHVEVRDGRRTNAAKSVGDYTLDNANPTAYWNSKGYSVQ